MNARASRRSHPVAAALEVLLAIYAATLFLMALLHMGTADPLGLRLGLRRLDLPITFVTMVGAVTLGALTVVPVANLLGMRDDR